ncbi:MAG TPA: TonB family protein [Candidatus Udaeobacter sp.]|nr:TonB family protein [Candidatus Udaeobacter sp.]
MKDLSLSFSLLGSSLVHVLILVLVSTSVAGRSGLTPPDLIPVRLLEIPPEASASQKEEKAPVQQEPVPPHRMKTANQQKAVTKREAIERDRLSPPPMPAVRQGPPPETKPSLSAPAEQMPMIPPRAEVEEGGSEAGSGNIFAQADFTVALGKGSHAGGGTGASGLGRDSGAPGLPANTGPLRTNREAKPLQTVRASYPPMALRLGLEGDVALRIEIDTEGKVTKADVIKSAGAAFDEEALKAVKQSRFEPARKDGLNVPAEFTYIYRFRLAK